VPNEELEQEVLEEEEIEEPGENEDLVMDELPPKRRKSLKPILLREK